MRDVSILRKVSTSQSDFVVWVETYHARVVISRVPNFDTDGGSLSGLLRKIVLYEADNSQSLVLC